AATTNEQLLHLVLTAARPGCQIRIVPDTAGPHGVLGGAFMLMGYAQHPDVAYVENLTASVFLENRSDITAYKEILEKLADIALNARQSREWLVQLASRYDQPESGAL